MVRSCIHIKLFFVFLVTVLVHVSLHAQVQPNIIFIIADDLNDYLEGYDAHDNTITPNLNVLREQGTTFLNAYASAPICAPSRTSFLSGKDLYYTNVYKNTDGDYKCKEFYDNFTAAEGNEVYFTLPQYLKDSLGYYTFNLNKVFHCHKNYIEYDEMTEDPCSRSGAWNRYLYYYDSAYIDAYALALDQGVNGYEWAAIPDSLEYRMTDYVATDSVIDFIQQYAVSPEYTCNRPFLIMLGYHKPHKEQFIPEKYFLDDYVTDYYATPFDPPFNFPKNTFPPNGIQLPPQPETPFSDLDDLLVNSISALMVKNIDTQFMEWAEDLDVLPEIDPTMTDAERVAFLQWSQRANGVMAYLAAVRYIDAQFGRLYESLLDNPGVMNNTIIVFIGDNGYALSEKRHWGKYGLWETDVRVPMIIADLRNPEQQISNRTVSLVDLFPTMIELAGGNLLPAFPDGTPYLDGRSIVPLLHDPDTVWTRPVISATKKQNNEFEASCFPQYSVRDERFHLIRYQTNGAAGGGCDSSLSSYQYELYELGNNRDVDPYEWNNLGYDQNYLPVIEYLEQWLPGNALYNKATFSLSLETNSNDCLLDQSDVIEPVITVFDADGNVITEAPGHVFRWTNNITEDTLYGAGPAISLSGIPEAVFNAHERMMLYVAMIDTATGAVAALDMAYIYLNPDNTPEAHFNVVHYGRYGVLVNDFSISGTYTNYWWDFGSGPQFHNTLPGPYYFDAPGPHVVTCYVEYGNDAACVDAFAVSTVTTQIADIQSGALIIWPNPASHSINIMCDRPIAGKTYTLLNNTGQLVGKVVGQGTHVIDQIDISNLPQGLYYIILGEDDMRFSGSFVVAR